MAAEAAKPDYKSELAEIVSGALESSYESAAIEFKPLFGAQACYSHGRIFASRGKFGLALKLPPGLRRDLIENDGAGHLRYFPKGHIKKEYVVIPQRIVTDNARRRELVTQSIAYVRSELP